MSNGKEAAFARPRVSGGEEFNAGEKGLTKREYFAIHILAGIFSHPMSTVDEKETNYAVTMADYLLKALALEKK